MRYKIKMARKKTIRIKPHKRKIKGKIIKVKGYNRRKRPKSSKVVKYKRAGTLEIGHDKYGNIVKSRVRKDRRVTQLSKLSREKLNEKYRNYEISPEEWARAIIKQSIKL